MNVKPASQLFREQFQRELHASYKVEHRKQIKKQYDKHNDAVIISLSKRVQGKNKQ